MKIMEKFHNLKFGKKLILSYLIIIIIPFSIWVCFSYLQTNQYLKEQQRQSFNIIFSTVVNNLEKKVSDVNSTITSVSRNPVIGEVASAKYSKMYDKYYDVVFRYDPIISNAFMLNDAILNVNLYANGDIKDSRPSFIPIEELHSKKNCETILNTIEVVWFTEKDELFAAQQVFYANNVNASSVIVMEIDKKVIFNHLIDDDNYDITIKNNFGEEIFTKKTKEMSSKNIIQKEQTFLPSKWKIDIKMDISSVLISPYANMQTLLFVILICIVLLAFMVILFSKTFVTRIEYLDQRLSRIVKSRFKIDIASDNTDEIGNITNSVGKMVKDTKKLIDEVYISKLAQKDSEIKALQSQINPHFLYNTLSAINWEAIKSNNLNISKIVTALSVFYRSTLNKGSSVTTIEGELNNIKAYIDIQKFTHNNSFDVEYNIDEKALEYNLPSIILQPIVENAILHGIDGNKGVRGKLIINVFCNGCDIIFEIIDNGQGVSYETINDVMKTKKKGYGVKNVDERLKLFFDKSYGIEYESEDGQGTKTTINIPKYVQI